jgi:hypothetical protein
MTELPVKSFLDKPVPGSKNLSAQDAALVTAFLIHDYEASKGKPVTRFRLSRDSVRKNGQQENLREAYIADWKEALSSQFGWVAFEVGEEFALIRGSLVKGWVKLGAKRFLETRAELRQGDRSSLEQMRKTLAEAAPEAPAAAA